MNIAEKFKTKAMNESLRRSLPASTFEILSETIDEERKMAENKRVDALIIETILLHNFTEFHDKLFEARLEYEKLLREAVETIGRDKIDAVKKYLSK